METSDIYKNKHRDTSTYTNTDTHTYTHTRTHTLRYLADVPKKTGKERYRDFVSGKKSLKLSKMYDDSVFTFGRPLIDG